MNKIVRALIFFVLTLFWGLISLHISGLLSGILAVLGTGVTAEATSIIERAMKGLGDIVIWKEVLSVVLAMMGSIIVLLLI